MTRGFAAFENFETILSQMELFLLICSSWHSPLIYARQANEPRFG